MRQTGRSDTLPLAIIAVALAAAVLSSSAMAAFAIARGTWAVGSWGMMDGVHMRGMMGGGSNSSGAPLSVGGRTESVAIRDFAFVPGNLQVPVGATVTWTNDDDAPHSAKAKDGSWDTGLLSKGDAKTLTFEQAGEYEYDCLVHPNMIARLTVR